MEYSLDLEEVCPVCGDKVSGYHYGLLTCESCKGFFKRTVQNNKKYYCTEGQQCEIDKIQRRRCPFCRFQKCLHVGMQLEAVRADRMRGGRNKFSPMYKRDRALKQWRKTMIQARGFQLQSGPPPVTPTHQKEFPFPVDIHPVPVYPGTQINMTQNEISVQVPSLFTFLPSNSASGSQNPCTSLTTWNVKSKNNHRSFAAGLHTDPDLHAGPLSESVCWDPDELNLRRRIATRLQQEQNHGKLSTFGAMFLMANDTLLFTVEWARRSTFFKHLEVSDQMKLLHSCWSELLLLDFISRQVLHKKVGSLLLITGQEVELSDLASCAGAALAALVQRGQDLVEKLFALSVDRHEFSCIKFLILFNPNVKQLEGHSVIVNVHKQVERALLDYMLSTSCEGPGRLAYLLLCLSELRSLSALAEDYLHSKHMSGEVSADTLLTEMLHAKRTQR